MLVKILSFLAIAVCLIGGTATAQGNGYLDSTIREMQKVWPGNRTINLVFHGHSVPSGYWHDHEVHTLESYPHLLLAKLKALYPYAVINVITTAIGGENSLSGVKRFDRDVLPMRPDVVFIDYSLNELSADLKTVRDAWSQMIRSALAKGIKVVLLTPSPDQRIDMCVAGNTLEKHAAQVRSLASEFHVGLVDSYELFREKACVEHDLPAYMSQVNHPNRAGHEMIADAILQWFMPSDKTAIVNTPEGEIGQGRMMAVKRLSGAPFTTLGWVRADLTDEVASADEKTRKSAMWRPFKNYSGDISGRYLELMAWLSNGDKAYHPVLRAMISDIPKLQKPDGTFGWAKIDWDGPIDFEEKGSTPIMMPALWGNGRMFCGLIKAYEVFKDPALLASARKLGDFYVRTADKFMDMSRVEEYKKGGTYAAGFVTCYFNAFEGLVKLYGVTRDVAYLRVAERMAKFLVVFDVLPLDHTHGMLCNQFALLQLYELTGRTDYRERVEKRWEQMVREGYSDATGGVLEAAKIGYRRDEGCAEADWLRVNLELYKVTGGAKYLDIVERLMQNHYLINQCSTGGFGHRFMLNDPAGVIGIGKYSEEATWCCDFHNTMGFELFRPYICELDGGLLRVNFAMDFSSKGAFTVRSRCVLRDTVMEQTIELSGNTRVAIRMPSWSDRLRVVDDGGRELSVVKKGDYYEVEGRKLLRVIYHAPVVVEKRGEMVVYRHGPKVLMKNGSGPLAPRPLGQDSLSSIFVFKPE